MYIQVKLLNGFQQELTYSTPKDWNTTDLLGSIVEVPLQKRTEYALVIKVMITLDTPVEYQIKEAAKQELLPNNPFYKKFIRQLARYYACEEMTFYKRVRRFLAEKEISDVMPSIEIATQSTTQLTQDQSAIVDCIGNQLGKEYYPALIHGVTGSGKTEIYKQLILQNFAQHKSTILLLPEVSLAVQFQKILTAQLPTHLKIVGFHSATSSTEKRTVWQHMMLETPLVLIGVHLPLLLPLQNLGLIIIDEEHETSFQEKKYPKVHTKEAALMRAQIEKIPIVLGSATPSIASLYNVQHKNWQLFELKKRFAGNFPTIQMVKLTKETKRAQYWISSELEQAIEDRLTKKEQIIIFINRRGYSFFVQCSECGFIPTCTQCSVSLTLHDNGILKCHYCNKTQPATETCAACKSSKLLKKGIGTQQAVSILQKLFPHARIDRADLDATVNKKKWQKVINDFEQGNLDILVGTQTITKGYHFPKVTLVGILWADINLNLPSYHNAETTLQQLIQVAGRAGRQSDQSLVIIQHLIDHPVFSYINEVNYREFYAYEIEKRSLVQYPPCVRFAEIEVRAYEEAIVEKDADSIANELDMLISKHNLSIQLLGPVAPAVHKIQNVYIRKLYFKSADINQMLNAFNSIDKNIYQSMLFFTPNPTQ